MEATTATQNPKNLSRKLLWVRLKNNEYASIPAGKTSPKVTEASLGSAMYNKLRQRGLLGEVAEMPSSNDSGKPAKQRSATSNTGSKNTATKKRSATARVTSLTNANEQPAVVEAVDQQEERAVEARI